MAAGARTNSPVGVLLANSFDASQVRIEIPQVRRLGIAVTPRYSYEEHQVTVSVDHDDLDLRAALEDSLVLPRLSFRIWLAEQLVVDDSAIGGLVLEHHAAVLVDVDAEVDVANALARVIREADVAAGRVTAKGKAHPRVLDSCREAKHDRVITQAAGPAKVVRIIFEVEVGVDRIGSVATYGVAAVLG